MADELRTAGRFAAAAAVKTGLGFWGWVVGIVGIPFIIISTFFVGVIFLAAMMGASDNDGDDSAVAAAETTCQPNGDSNIPEKYRDDVAEAAKTSGFPAAVIAAQIETESGWRENAYNAGSKAAGMAQFIPDTWASVMGNADPYDGHLAVEAQGIYMGQLREMMKKHFNLSDDDEKLVDYTLAGYNAGPGRVFQQNGVPTRKGNGKPNTETPAYVKMIKTKAQNKYSKACEIVTVSAKEPAPSKSGPGDWTNPLPGSWVTSHFGYRGSHICGNGMTFHEGVDIAGGGSKYFYAPTDMIITAVNQSGTGITTAEIVYGAYIYAKQDGGEGYGFEFHENKVNSLRVKVGDRVKKGTALGEVGMSGTGSRGVHVHFQINKPGTDMSKPTAINNCHGVDPIPILKSKGAWK